MRIAHGATTQKPGVQGPMTGPIAGPQPLPPSNPVANYDFLFPELAENPDALLPVSSETVTHLACLGETMRDPGTDLQALNASSLHAGYTYLGQFIDHDIAFTSIKRDPAKTRDSIDSCMLGDSLLKPWTPDEIREKVTNQRHAILELETVYGSASKPAPRDPADPRLMLLGRVKDAGAMTDAFNDIPLVEQALMSGERDPAIGDKRNDQTVILSQLHVAFLRAHNAIARSKPNLSFIEVRRLLTQHYHWMVIHDFLNRIAPGIFEEIKLNPLYNPEERFFLPLEFTVAAFRFGHSMIRGSYYLNKHAQLAILKNLYTLKALGSSTSLPEERIIDWNAFLPGGDNIARRIDTRMVEPLMEVLDADEQPVPCETRLAVHDLRRGYMMSIPTGQAVARLLDIKPLEEHEFLAHCASEKQFKCLKDTGFLERTPLWFYILAEASREGGNKLGPVGARLVGEVLVGLVRRSPSSFMKDATFKPTLGITPGKFELKDLFKLAGVLSDQSQ